MLEWIRSPLVGPQSHLEEPGRTDGADDDGVGPGLAIFVGTELGPL